jgi:hypothetical protein
VAEQPHSITIRIGTADPTRIQDVLDRLRQGQCVIRRVEMVRPSLEDLFMEAMGEAAPPALHPPVPAGSEMEARP